MDAEGYADKLISEAIVSGELDPQEGAGEPLGTLDTDPDWWIKAFLEREQLPDRHREFLAVWHNEVHGAIIEADLSIARERLGRANQLAKRWNRDAPANYRAPVRSEVWLLSERARSPTDERPSPTATGG